MELNLKDKVVIVTGGGGAIGSAISEAFAKEGAKVVVAGLRLSDLDGIVKVIRESGGECTPLICDVTDMESAKNLIAETVKIYGKLDCLVNNAGINGGPEYRKRTHEYDDSLWKRIIDCDLNGVYYCSKHAIAQMLSQGTPSSIINISSVAGVFPLRLQAAFTAAKAGVINLSKAMAIEYAGDNIRVNVICPGSIMFEGTKKLFYANPETAEKMMASIPMNRPGDPADIASAACFMASETALGYMTGSVQVIDGGWTSSMRMF